MEELAITQEEVDILKHALSTGRYLASDRRGLALAQRGFLRDYGPQRLANGDHYFTITMAGRVALQEHQAAMPKPKPLTRSQQRYRDWLRYGFGTFGEWIRRGGEKR